MSGRAVACTGDASATAGRGIPTTADSGTWTAGPLSQSAYPKVKVGGATVLHEVSCTFSFAGTKGNSAVAASSTVTLRGAANKLEPGTAPPLRDGDAEQDSYGNRVSVSSSRKMRVT